MTSPFAWLGAASQSTPWIVLIHGGESTAPKLKAVLPGANAVVVYRQGSNTGYDEVTGLAKEYPTLRGLLSAVAPGWAPGTPLIVMGFSAGGWALRYYLRDASAHGDITAAVFLDSLYGAPNGICDLSPYQGVIAYGKEANASPTSKRLIMTYSQGTPAPGICSQAVAKAAGGTGKGVFVMPYANGDHSAQQNVAGPAAIKEHIAPWLGGSSRGSSGASSGGGGWVVAGLAAVAAIGAVAMAKPRMLNNPIVDETAIKRVANMLQYVSAREVLRILVEKEGWSATDAHLALRAGQLLHKARTRR